MHMLISGNSVLSSDGKTINVYNPVTGKLIDTIPDATKDDVELAIKYAKQGQKEWAAKNLREREAVFAKYASLIEEHKNELAALLTEEMGKPFGASMFEVLAAASFFKGYMETVKHSYDRVNPRNTGLGHDKDFQMVVHEPLGAVAAIIPFNLPVILFANKAAPALAVGNAVIVKPASDNPLTIIRMTELLVEAGVPANAAQIVTGRGGACGAYLVSSPDINGIFFTGSTEAGLEIASLADRNLTPCFLELGGNDPCIVLEDADIEIAVTDLVRDRLANAGQICVSPKRVIVHQSVVNEFTKRLSDEVAKVKVGDPFDETTMMGSLISEKAAIEVQAQIEKTVSQGAELLCGGVRNGAFLTPAILGNVTKDMDIAKDMEVFGPVFAIIAVKDADEAVAVANQTKYGLSSGVFTKDIAKGMTVASKIEAGACVINGTGFYITPYQPFGGIKMSGKGREGYSVSLYEHTYEKTITVKNMYK